MSISEPPYRALITITTCRRLDRIRRYLPHFAQFCAGDSRFSLLVALDGKDEAYEQFCEAWSLPLVYSAEREGVGISKNRVLERFPDFDYYFFLDDDVELTDGEVFPAHVRLAQESRIHHFSLFERDGMRTRTGETIVGDRRVAHGMFGGGQFNFFTKEGLERVGGWHTDFAEFRRWGHTEHTYRFFNAGLTPAPFNMVIDLADACIWHYPPPVTKAGSMAVDEDQISTVERRLMDAKLDYFPVKTLSKPGFNGQPFTRIQRLAGLVSPNERYPLATREERRQSLADYSLWRARSSAGRLTRLTHLVRAAAYWPSNPRLRHQLKTGR